MYKLLLCWRYLRTRYIALASIISVTLGVTTLIVVNSVMEGFSQEMQSRMHGILSDISFESTSMDGMPDFEMHMREIRGVLGDDIVGMTPTVFVPAMMTFKINNQTITRPIHLIGIDEKTYSSVGDFGKYLQNPENRKALSFELRDDGYDVYDHQAADRNNLKPRLAMESAGWVRRKLQADLKLPYESLNTPGPTESPEVNPSSATTPPEEFGTTAKSSDTLNPFDAPAQEVFDPKKNTHPGVVLGFGLASYRDAEGSEGFLVLPGDDIRITYPSGTLDTRLDPKVSTSSFTVVDLYESKMNEFDEKFVFVPLDTLQGFRGMVDPHSGKSNVTSILLKLRPGANLEEARNKLRAHFPEQLYGVFTWKDKQGPILAAVDMESKTLNVLLFLIIAVAGFGILAIFFMIVVEKTRDIGILKSLGASRSGIMGIFLTYGLCLGAVGAGAGLIGGLVFVHYINEIADLIGQMTGQEVFNPEIYYFQGIPTIVQVGTITWVVVGAMLIAVLASILPARRAARLNPVDALRHA